MKTIYIKITALCLMLMVSFNACNTDNLAELNVDPRVASEIDPGFILAYTQLQTSGERYENWRTVMIFQSVMIQHFAALATYWVGDKYLHNDSYSAALWDRAYVNYVKDLVNLADITDPTKEGNDASNVNYHAIARIWKVFAFQRITDIYGDVPYFDAGKGFIDQNFFPAYDPQEAIYPDLANELEEAVALLDESQINPGSQDLIYGGDLGKWRRFGNSLMLRIGMRMSKVAPNLAQEYVGKAIAGGVMTSNDDICYISHTDGPEGINRNGIGEVFNWDGTNYTNDDQGVLSKTFVDWMLAGNDPRLEKLSWVRNGGEPMGLPNGYDGNTIENFDPLYTTSARRDDYSRINPLFVLRESPMVFQTYAEVEFLIAEAIERGWATGVAADHYNAGVTAAMKQFMVYDASLEVADADITSYLAANPYNSAEWDRILGEQYWAATILNEYEAYANWRRTGFPELTPVNYPGNQTNGTIPRRLRYPGAEAANNPEGYSAAVARQGPDTYTTRIWWDVE
ncbi:SusD/RagB family nutrient-binding outer membrane lipoprotein [Echinicola shivajiensis]|uniref:SusD/RagB family nutrient-binding outer membrane lipoprotein n=1 Tax=Echinicola shivajiensis TaxID=1035916 RepID=UPI001BFC6C43|nr:SusD/RagB family nutrient-binding outer membrane lipoprotein [Echinicola shivajiensis]